MEFLDIDIATLLMAFATAFLAIIAFLQWRSQIPRIKCYAALERGPSPHKGKWSTGIKIDNKDYYAFYLILQNRSDTLVTVRDVQVKVPGGKYDYGDMFVLESATEGVIVDLQLLDSVKKAVKWRFDQDIPHIGPHEVKSLRDYKPFTLKQYEYRHLLIAVHIPHEHTSCRETHVKVEPIGRLWWGRPRYLAIQGWAGKYYAQQPRNSSFARYT